jgi:hypothetical protein
VGRMAVWLELTSPEGRDAVDGGGREADAGG